MTLRTLSNISEIIFDVIIIGAGINGAGVARDAAMRGLKVLLLDKGDIGGGTSSLSTRLIHGGLRYLEHGELALVRESLRERERLIKIAPHLIGPLPILVPVYKHARRGWWTIKAGMIAYDALTAGGTFPRHRMLSQAETLLQAPGLYREGLLGAALYYDAQVEFAERLVLENALSAMAHGATVLTYARVEKFVMEAGELRGVEFTDQQRHWARAKIVINAAGPWVDQVLEENATNSARLIGGTKGSHIIVAPFAGAPDNAVYVEAKTDARPFFIIPWNGNYLIGTTDIRYEGDLDHVRIEAEEIAYLLRETNRVIPAAQLTAEQILYSYSGVRPLPFTDKQDEQRITRRHFIRRHQHLENLYSIVGGKLTTYRSLAEEAVDLICERLQRQTINCPTGREPLPGADTPDFAAFSKTFKQTSGLPAECNLRLLRIYGTRVSSILDLISEDPSLAEVFDPETRAIAAEVVFAFRHELAQTLTDCLLRRTMVGLNSTCGLEALEATAAVAQKALGWSDSQKNQQTEEYREEVSRRFSRFKMIENL